MGDVLTTLDHLFTSLVLNVSTVYSSQYPLLPATAISPCVIPVSGCASLQTQCHCSTHGSLRVVFSTNCNV